MPFGQEPGFCGKIIEQADLERLQSPSSPAAPLIRARMHQRRGLRSGGVVMPSPSSTSVYPAEPGVLRPVLIALVGDLVVVMPAPAGWTWRPPEGYHARVRLRSPVSVMAP
jgi:hypothetical protein